MSICQFCRVPADFTVVRRHPYEDWEVRLLVCECCLCARLPVLDEESVIDESVVPVGLNTLVAFAPMVPVALGTLKGQTG